MTFAQILYFLKVYETGSFSTAAQELFISRSAISKAVHELEMSLGTPLFLRTQDGLVPTPFGKTLREKGMEIVSLMDETEAMMHNMVHAADCSIRIGITPTTGITIFPHLYRVFTALYPDIQLIPIEGGNAKVQSMLDSGRMDACFTTFSTSFPDAKGKLRMTDRLDSMLLYETKLVLCVDKTHPLAKAEQVSIRDILTEPLVFLKKPLQREAEVTYRFLQEGKEPNVVFRASQLAIAGQIVRSGMASSIQIRGTLDDNRDILGIPISPPAIYGNYLVWNRSALRQKGFSAFLEFCKSMDYSQFN